MAGYIQAIQELRNLQDGLSRVIALLEEIQRGSTGVVVPGRRGRKKGTMSARERRQVSARIIKYWTKKKKLDSPGIGPPVAGADLTRFKIPPGREEDS